MCHQVKLDMIERMHAQAAAGSWHAMSLHDGKLNGIQGTELLEHAEASQLALMQLSWHLPWAGAYPEQACEHW